MPSKHARMKNMIINRSTCGGPKKGGLVSNSGAYYGQWFMKRRATKRVDKKKYPKVCRGEHKHKLTLAELILYFMVHGEKHPDMNQRNPDISKMRAEIEKSLILNNGLTLDQLNRAKSFNEGFKRGNTNQIKEVLTEVIELWGIYMIDPKGSRIGKRIGKIRNLGAKHGPCSVPTSSSVNLDDPPSSPPWPICLACVNKKLYPGDGIAAQQKSCCDSNCDACNLGPIDGEIVNDVIQPMLSRFICVVIYTLYWIMMGMMPTPAVIVACETCGVASELAAFFYFVKEFLENVLYDLVEWMIDELVYALAHLIMSKSAETAQVIADCIVHVIMWYFNNVATGTGPVSDISEFLSQIIIDTICGEGSAGFLCDTQPELAFASEGQDCKKDFNENAEPPPSFGDKMCSPLAPRCRVSDNICRGRDGKYFKGSEKFKFSGEFLLFRHPDKLPITCGRAPNINTIFAGYEVNLGYCGPNQPVPTPAVEDAWVSPKAIWDQPCPSSNPNCGSRPDWIWDYATKGAMNDSYGENMLCKDFNNDPENCGGCNIKCSDSDMECSYGHCIGCPGHCDYARGWMCLPDQGLCMTYSNTDPPAPPVIPEDQEQFYINSDNLAPQPDTDNAKKLRNYIACDSTQNDPDTGLSTECNKKVGQKHPMTCQQVCPGGSCIGPVDAALSQDGFTGKCVPNSIHEEHGTCKNNKCNYKISGKDRLIFNSDTSCTTDASCNVWVSGFHGICTQAFKGCVRAGAPGEPAYVYSDICHAAGLISEEQCTNTESCHWIDQCTKLVDTYPLCGLCSQDDMPSPNKGLHGCVANSLIGEEPYVWGYDQLEPCGRRYHCGLISQVDIDGITYPVGQCVGPQPDPDPIE